MEKKVIRVGSVGVGAIWGGVHEPGIAKSPDLTLVAICDIDEKKLEAVGEKYGIPPQYRFTDYRDLVNCDIVDAVDICTSNDAHFKVAMAAVEAGKPFNLEKPITLTAEEADILAKAAQEKNVKNMVCFSYRFKAAARYAKDLIAQGKIGRVYHVNMQYFQAWGLPRANCPLVWRYVKSRTGTGALGDLGSHALDLVRFVTNKEYTRVVGHTGTYVHERPLLDGKGVGKVDVDDFSNYMADMEVRFLSASRLPDLLMAAVTISVWRFTVVRVPLSTAWMPHLPELTKLKSAPETSMPMPMFSTICPFRSSISPIRCSPLQTL